MKGHPGQALFNKITESWCQQAHIRDQLQIIVHDFQFSHQYTKLHIQVSLLLVFFHSVKYTCIQAEWSAVLLSLSMSDASASPSPTNKSEIITSFKTIVIISVMR